VLTKVPGYRKAIPAKANSMTIFTPGQLFLPASRFQHPTESGGFHDYVYISFGYVKPAGVSSA
jgi:hypothetical protein